MTELAVVLHVAVALQETVESSHDSYYVWRQHHTVLHTRLTFNIQCLQGMDLLLITVFLLISGKEPFDEPDMALGRLPDIGLFIFTVESF